MEQFDVFLCHNSKDKPAVIQVAQQLQDKGIKPWLDIWHLRPGFSWQRALEQQINQIASAAVFVGKSGFGPWQSQEVDAFLRAFVNRQCPVIPVLLSNAPTKPQLPLFLQGLTWVDFRQQHPDPMEQLIWGITGHRPNTQTGTGSSQKYPPIIDRREFLKWAGWGSVGLVTTVVGREIFIKLNHWTLDKKE
ncbi:MAG: toll/interleukin-1 receptor domain-containing protein [Pelatocladus maniniholoensis HA4357-MV3]|uniref:Toll/interleukin-1 receptor domain-containing protein n=1 Tax=Pelatocladus maniniholoensis HA4357-MV3 TaxID=1117104 RepID=A0A9E3H8P4_9NOST|nr:toll/interleukin-1 receptor domain-containing protein [Pelatocladus maniniholoensis HA4357-MV3]